MGSLKASYIALAILHTVSSPIKSRRVNGPKGWASVLYSKEIAAAENPEEERERREQEWRDTYLSAYYSASLQHIDDIIDPKETRRVLFAALEALENKNVHRPNKKHGNIPL